MTKQIDCELGVIGPGNMAEAIPPHPRATHARRCGLKCLNGS